MTELANARSMQPCITNSLQYAKSRSLAIFEDFVVQGQGQGQGLVKWSSRILVTKFTTIITTVCTTASRDRPISCCLQTALSRLQYYSHPSAVQSLDYYYYSHFSHHQSPPLRHYPFGTLRRDRFLIGSIDSSLKRALCAGTGRWRRRFYFSTATTPATSGKSKRRSGPLKQPRQFPPFRATDSQSMQQLGNNIHSALEAFAMTQTQHFMLQIALH